MLHVPPLYKHLFLQYYMYVPMHPQTLPPHPQNTSSQTIPPHPQTLTLSPSLYFGGSLRCTLRDSILGASWMILGRSKWMWPWLWIWASVALREMSASLGPRGLPCQFSLSSMLGKPFPDHTHTDYTKAKHTYMMFHSMQQME